MCAAGNIWCRTLGNARAAGIDLACRRRRTLNLN